MKRICKWFTLIEMIIVIIILWVLIAALIPKILGVKEAAYIASAKANFRMINGALQMLLSNNGGIYPPDSPRNVLPVTLEPYLNTQPMNQRAGPRPSSVYDRDNVTTPSQSPIQPYIQLGIRFCPIAWPIDACRFPNEVRASWFDINSSVFFCVNGPCRSHAFEAITYPGKCLDC